MKRTWKDNLMAKMRQQIRDHKRLKLPITAGMILVTLFYNIVFYFVHNTKRFASVLVLLIFFREQQLFFPEKIGLHGTGL